MSERPIPQPRKQRAPPTPAPRARTKPSDDVLTNITFSSPLQLSEPPPVEQQIPPRPSRQRSNSNDYMEMKAPRISYENVSLSSKPPSIPPPPLPDESTYDIPPQRISTDSATNTTLTCEIAPNITISSDDIIVINEDIYVPPGFNGNLSGSDYANIKLNNNEQRSPVMSQDLENSNVKLLENIQIRSKPNAVENRTLPPVYMSDINDTVNFLTLPDNVEVRSKNNETSRKPTESVLLNFDPLFEDSSKKVSLNLLDDIFGALGSQYNGENACSLPLKQNLYDIAEGTEGYAQVNKVRKEKKNIGLNEKYSETGSNLVENSSKKDIAEKYGLPRDEYAEVHKPKRKEERESRVPTPPLRSDSIPREDIDKMEPGIMPRDSVMMRNSPESDSEKKTGKLGKFKSMKNFTRNILHKQNSNSMSSILQNCKPIGRPMFSEINYAVHYTGVLVQPGRDRTEWGVTLSQGLIKWVSDKAENELNVHNITSIAAFTPAASASSSQSPPMYCMELSSVNDRGVQQMQLFTTPLPSLRSTWLQRILEATTSAVFPKEITKDFTRAGWLNIKEGVSGSWLPCWILLREREIFYSCQPDTLYDADLRKARCIIPQSSGGLLEELGCILLELHGRSLYLQAPNERDTNRWGHSIRAAAFNNGTMLHEQQLTKDNVPVIVEKCVNFVLQQGAISEGIYRRSGVQSVVSGLLQEFKKDAWSVQLSRTKYSEHEVATALKRFFKDLPEPLISLDLTPQLCRVAASTLSEGEKVSKYRRLLQKLTPIHYVTSRKIFGHLHFLHLESKRNLMTARNLAAIWGISLMHQQPHFEMTGVGLSQTQAPLGDGQSKIVTDLITLYPQLYDVAESEIARELQMLSVVERFHTSAPSNQPISSKPSGDLRLWIAIGKPGSQDTIQIAVGPQKTASQVCAELDRGPKFMLQEFVLGGALARVLHPNERVLEAVVRWGYWDEIDRKDNQLVLAPCQLYEDIKPIAKPPLMACCELKFADNRSKNFKNHVMELSQAKLACYKDRKLSSRNVEWNIEDVVWYLGHEPKRDPLTKWSITFIQRQNKPNRSKEHPYFGHTMAGNIEEEKLYWCAAMFLAEHPEGL